MTKTRTSGAAYQYFPITDGINPLTSGAIAARIYRTASDDAGSNYGYAVTADAPASPIAISKYNDMNKYVLLQNAGSATDFSPYIKADPREYPFAYASGVTSVLTNDGLIYCYSASKQVVYDLLRETPNSTLTTFSGYVYFFGDRNLIDKILSNDQDTLEGQRIAVQMASDGSLSYTRIGLYKEGTFTYYGSPCLEADAYDAGIGHYKTETFVAQSSDFKAPYKRYWLIVSDAALAITHETTTDAFSDSLLNSKRLLVLSQEASAPYWYLLASDYKYGGPTLKTSDSADGISYVTFRISAADTSSVPSYIRII